MPTTTPRSGKNPPPDGATEQLIARMDTRPNEVAIAYFKTTFPQREFRYRLVVLAHAKQISRRAVRLTLMTTTNPCRTEQEDRWKVRP
jgi:hypothetical protein